MQKNQSYDSFFNRPNEMTGLEPPNDIPYSVNPPEWESPQVTWPLAKQLTDTAPGKEKSASCISHSQLPEKFNLSPNELSLLALSFLGWGSASFSVAQASPLLCRRVKHEEINPGLAGEEASTVQGILQCSISLLVSLEQIRGCQSPWDLLIHH